MGRIAKIGWGIVRTQHLPAVNYLLLCGCVTNWCFYDWLVGIVVTQYLHS